METTGAVDKGIKDIQGAVMNDDKKMFSESPTGRIEIGNRVPDFTLFDVDGREHKLSDYLGHKLMLCFYRYSFCPVSAMSFGRLMGNYKKLAWASKLKVVTVFRTDREWLQKGLTSEEAPIARLCNGVVYPFIPLADPDGKVGDLFCVEHKSKILHLMDYFTIRRELVRYHNTRRVSSSTSRLEKKSISGAASILPSELLIDEHGVLVDILRAHENADSMTMDRISHFLLLGEKLPDGDKPRTKRSSVPSSFGRSTHIVGGTESTRRRMTMPASFSFDSFRSLRRS